MKLLTSTCAAVIVWMSASGLSGEAVPYTNYEVDMRIEASATSSTGVGNFTEVPWPWYSVPDNSPAPFWNVNARVVEVVEFTGPPTVDPVTLVATTSYISTRTLQAHDENNPEAVIGTMVWSGIGNGVIDFNASRSLVDEDAGTIMIKVGQSEGQPFATYTFLEETGVFLDDGIVPVRDPNNPDDLSDSKAVYSGWFVLPVLPGVDVNDPLQLQENIFAAPVIDSFGEGVWTGYYIPEPATFILAALAFAGLPPLVRRQRKQSRGLPFPNL